MKKRIPELLGRFNKLKENNPNLSASFLETLNKFERPLIEKLFQMGDSDFHSIHGILTDTEKIRGPRNSTSGVTSKHNFIIIDN